MCIDRPVRTRASARMDRPMWPKEKSVFFLLVPSLLARILHYRLAAALLSNDYVAQSSVPVPCKYLSSVLQHSSFN